MANCVPTDLIKETYIGDAYERIQGEVEFGFFSVSPKSIRREDNYTTLTVTIAAADRLQQDDSNTMDVFDDMQRAVRSTLNVFEENYPVDVITYNLEFFKQQYADYVGGVVGDVDIVFADDIGICEVE